MKQEEKDYFKPIGVRNFWNNNYIEYESSGDRNMSHDNANEVVNELFESLLSRYQIGLENQWEGDFIFDSVERLYYKYHKINLKSGGSYIDSLGLDKKEKSNNKSKKWRW